MELSVIPIQICCLRSLGIKPLWWTCTVVLHFLSCGKGVTAVWKHEQYTWESETRGAREQRHLARLSTISTLFLLVVLELSTQVQEFYWKLGPTAKMAAVDEKATLERSCQGSDFRRCVFVPALSLQGN